MTTMNLPHGLTGQAVASRMLFLAYEASEVFGMGTLKARSGVTENQLWENVVTNGDYPVNPDATMPTEEEGKLSSDYCFGRMMKLNITYTKDSVTYTDYPPKKDYQSWCRSIPTYNDLANRAIKSLQKAAQS